MKNLFATPQFANEEQTQQAQQLYVILWTLILSFAVALSLLTIALPEATWRWWLPLGGIDMLGVGLILLTRRGFSQLASKLLIIILWVITTVMVITAGGIHSIANFGYFIVVFMAGLLLGLRMGVITAIASSLMGIGLVYAEWVGVLPSSAFQENIFSLWIIQTLFLAITVALQYIATSIIAKSLQKAHQELTERRLSEEKYRSIFENAFEGIFQSTPQGHILNVNPALYKTFGYESAQEMISTVNDIEYQLYVNPDDRKKMMDLIAKNGYIENYEIENRRKDGKSIWLSTNMRAVYGVDGAISCFEGTFLDITRRKLMEQGLIERSKELTKIIAQLQEEIGERKRAEENILIFNAHLEERVHERTLQLEIANEELEAFAYSVSHDLRAPLRSLDGFCKILVEDHQNKLDEQSQQYLDRIQKASQKMNQLINALLNLSHITRADFNRQEVNLSMLSQEIASELQMQAPKREVVFVITDNLVVKGDANLVKIVLENLLDNAFKYTSQRDRAYIQVGKIDQPGDHIYFVRDNGAGFNMDYANKLFAPFQRLHNVNEFPGTGIGLATVKRIITRHGGRIWAEAAVNMGATFYFTLGES